MQSSEEKLYFGENFVEYEWEGRGAWVEDIRTFISHLTCSSICFDHLHSSTENAPPINQRRTLQLSKEAAAGFGFTLQVMKRLKS